MHHAGSQGPTASSSYSIHKHMFHVSDTYLSYVSPPRPMCHIPQHLVNIKCKNGLVVLLVHDVTCKLRFAAKPRLVTLS